jgi:hypothetical protein
MERPVLDPTGVSFDLAGATPPSATGQMRSYGGAAKRIASNIVISRGSGFLRPVLLRKAFGGTSQSVFVTCHALRRTVPRFYSVALVARE